MASHELNVLLAGVGGQGTVMASRIIGRVAMKISGEVSLGETYGASQRGGSVLSHVRIGARFLGPLVPRARGDLILGFEPLECMTQASVYLKRGGSILCNSRPLYPVDVVMRKAPYPSLDSMVGVLRKISRRVVLFDAVELACRAGSPLTLSAVMVGAFAASPECPYPRHDFEREISCLPSPAENLCAFKLGYDVAT